MTHPHPHPGYTPPPPVKKSRTGRIVLIVVGVVILLCLGGGILAAIGASNDDTPRPLTAQDRANREAATTTTTATTAPAPAATTTSPAAAKPTKTEPAPVRLGEGTYRVGEDIPAGRYKAVERADAECYWAREKGTAIVDNNIGGGFPQFRARDGEDVTIGYGCPEFERLGK